MRIQSRRGAAVLFTVILLGACSSSSSPTIEADASTAQDASEEADAGVDTGAPDAAPDTSPDASVTPVNGCGPTEFAASDHTAASDPRAITFATTPSPVQFSPSCMRIKAGQTVTWSGDFSDHPFEPMPAVPDDPIMDVTSGTTTSVTFPAAGTFGFDCAMHPSIMHGAIEVVP